MIYCDLLGVLVQQTGREGIAHMPWAFGGRKIWDYIKDDKPIILAQCRLEEYEKLYQEHRDWIDRELGVNVRLFCVTDDIHKSVVCEPGDTLIDDNHKYRQGWSECGGHFIHHNPISPDKTIEMIAKRKQASNGNL